VRGSPEAKAIITSTLYPRSLRRNRPRELLGDRLLAGGDAILVAPIEGPLLDSLAVNEGGLR